MTLPLVRFSEIQDRYQPTAYALFIAISYTKLNQVRKRIFDKAIDMGYTLPSYISSKASIVFCFYANNDYFLLKFDKSTTLDVVQRS